MSFLSCPFPALVCNPFGLARDGIYGLLAAIVPEPLPTVALTVLGIAMLIAIIALTVMSQVWVERRAVAFLQERLGPNRVGPAGVLQSVADVLKLLLKEDLIPFKADRATFVVAPLVVLVPSLSVWSLIPWGPGLAIADVNVGILLVLAIGSFTTLGILAAGWASANKYSLLGGMRVAAQLISYEVPLVVSALVPVLWAGTASLQGIIESQATVWNVFVLPVGPIAFLVFLIAGIAEVNRSPFDLPEAESEIVAGFHTEYSGMRFALFFLAEYSNSLAIGALAAVLFLGGWQGPILPPYVWLFFKAYAVFLILVWIRGTLPRLRYDQLMHFGWKVALPISLVTLGATAVLVSAVQGTAA
ncbi:MAG: NADH-quinone oxidoreductase subunit NuoH [Chloroflexi bacterium]|nr:NADH-quinone oxidoreductase subunit NuoH [Chloroflexota bacterium]